MVVEIYGTVSGVFPLWSARFLTFGWETVRQEVGVERPMTFRDFESILTINNFYMESYEHWHS